MPEREAQIEVTYTFTLPFDMDVPGYSEDMTAVQAAQQLLHDPGCSGGIDHGLMPDDTLVSIDAKWLTEGEPRV